MEAVALLVALAPRLPSMAPAVTAALAPSGRLPGGALARASSSSRRRARSRLLPRPAYGVSRPDGTWVENPTNQFAQLINIAKGKRDVVQAGTPCLREIAEPIPPDQIDTAKIQELVQEMLQICRDRGVGLAAPQIGVPYRVFVMEDTEEGMSDVPADDLAAQDRAPFAAKVIINPTVTPASAATALFWEGCLSVQGYRGLVRRFLAVRVEGLGADGAPVDFVAKGWQARIAQHEMDHLNGVLYVDRMDTRTFRRVDKLDEPLPGDHPELGPAPKIGPCAAGGGDVRARGADDVEGFIGKKKKAAAAGNKKKRRSR